MYMSVDIGIILTIIDRASIQNLFKEKDLLK